MSHTHCNYRNRKTRIWSIVSDSVYESPETNPFRESSGPGLLLRLGFFDILSVSSMRLEVMIWRFGPARIA